MLITSADQAAECDGCKQLYRVMQLHFDARKPGPSSLEIAKVARERVIPTSQAR